MSESMNIAFYTDTFLPAVDGVVTSIINFRNELERRGHTVYLFASGDSRTKAMTRGDKDVFVVRGTKFKKYPQYNLALFPFISPLKTRNLQIDIAHAHTPFTMGAYSLVYSRLNRIPNVGSFHTLFTSKSVIKEYTTRNRMVTKVLQKYSWPYAKFFYGKCDSVIAPSGSIKDLLVKKGIGNVSIVPNSVDTKRFNPKVSGTKIRSRVMRNERNKLVLYAGRLSKEKKLDVLIKAARRLKDSDIEFIIGGTGPAESYYRGLVARYNLQSKVRFVGFIDPELLPNFYAAADLFCIPSTFETQGIVSLEAMATGKPVVGADYLALGEMIKNGKNGEKFRPGDSRACASKISKVINNMSSYKSMLETARSYSVERTTDQLLDVYKKTIDEHRENL
ncbi:MAG TPA: glycosyltransferase [Candidatus Acidoferrales bacterium]|nr:glycosyltransferase [Candidatus Acidoferrales bacterium]